MVAARERGERGLDHPPVDRADQVVPLGGGEKGARRDDGAVVAAHAQQQLAEAFGALG